MNLYKIKQSKKRYWLFCLFVIFLHCPVRSQLTYSYYEGTWTQLPNFSTLTYIKQGTSPTFDVGVRNRDDNFGIVWEGKITITTPGTYTFETVSDDGSKFYFNSTYLPGAIPLINNDGLHGPWSPVGSSVTISAAGVYPIAMTFFEAGGGEAMELYWTGPGIPRQLVPPSALIIPIAPPPPPPSTGGGWALGGNTLAAGNFLGTNANDPQPLILRTNGQNRLQILSDGNMIIGTQQTTSQLAVYGNIKAMKLTVTAAPWSDYVFNKSYKLHSLKYVENYILTHHHLPDVPSAAKVESSGVDIGGHMATLLRKIEELTLYIIEQNKKLERQQRQINELKKTSFKK